MIPTKLGAAAYHRAACQPVPTENVSAARSRGSATECTTEAAELLRIGEVRLARQLLHSALYYIERWEDKE
jgi:hypothetical protein